MNTCNIQGCKVGDKSSITTLAEGITRDIIPFVRKLNELVNPEYAIWVTGIDDNEIE